MRILISGTSGLIGSALVPYLQGKGHSVKRLVRTRNSLSDQDVFWDPESEIIDLSIVDGMDAVINLSGENVATGRWTEKKKDTIRSSRIMPTRTLANAIAKVEKPPAVFINASAMGYYGDRQDQEVAEDAPSGSNFLAGLCREWEASTLPAKQRGVRVVCLRTSMVLSDKGGALAKILPLFKLGMGGVIGSGKQYMSWITLDDQIRSIEHILLNKELKGPVNLATPNPVTNEEFIKILAKVLNRPTLISVPAGVLRFTLGEMADELLLSSLRLKPQRLLETGFVFDHPELEEALRSLLKLS